MLVLSFSCLMRSLYFVTNIFHLAALALPLTLGYAALLNADTLYFIFLFMCYEVIRIITHKSY